MTQPHDEKRVAKCAGKEPLTHAIASALRLRYRKKGLGLSVYRCEYCGQWHTGSNYLGRQARKK
jgi:hypothetical protein